MAGTGVADTVLYCDWPNRPLWEQELRQAGLRLQVVDKENPEAVDPGAVRFAVCWNPPPGLLQQFPNLVAVQSMGAGVDSFFVEEGQVPDNAQLLRIVDPLMAQRMAMWALWGVINYQRKFDEYWEYRRSAPASGIRAWRATRTATMPRCGAESWG